MNDGYALDSQVGTVLDGLGFRKEDWTRYTEEFSGGWQMRIALAKLLLAKPNLLLLDEPTNHLDLETRNWLEQYLLQYPFAYVLISHDRYFLDVTVDRIIEIWNKGVHFYSGNYEKYLAQKQERRDSLVAAYKNQRERIEQLEAFINRFRYQATKAKQVQSRIKELEKIERIEIPPDEKTIHFTFPQPKPSGRLVVEATDVAKSYGPKEVFRDKSSEEISLLRRSTEITEAVYREVFGLLRVGLGRSELTREAKSRLIKNGATGISHVTLSFTQANPEIDIDERLEADKLVTIDIGGIYHGYCSDTRRYAYTGSVPEAIRERYEHMVEIVDAVGEALMPGTSFEHLFRLAQDQYAKHGIKALPRFNHIGHNIGLETEERWLDESSAYSVKSGMVINIELYSATDTGEQVGNEDTYVIGESGPLRISQLPREIREIG